MRYPTLPLPVALAACAVARPDDGNALIEQ